MPRERLLKLNNKGRPIIPTSYQKIGKGRKIKKGDRYASLNAMRWLPTSLLPGKIIEKGTYIRKIKLTKKQKEETKNRRIKFVADKLKKNFIDFNELDRNYLFELSEKIIEIVNLSNREVQHNQ